MIKLRKFTVLAAGAVLLVVGVQLVAGQKPGPEPHSKAGPPAESHNAPVASPVGRGQLSHIIEPPDLVLVEVLEALPGRPISGERLVRPDGTISLGFYGDVEVAGLTIPQAKERIVHHMKRFLTDEILGLVQIDPETGLGKKDAAGNVKAISARDSDRVFVDVTAYNSKFFFVSGCVNSVTPTRLPVTGGDTVLDALSYVGGLAPGADSSKIRVLRSFPKGSPVQTLPVDYDQITSGTDMTTNYQLVPGDRIIVPRAPATADSGKEPPVAPGRPRLPDENRSSLYFNRDGTGPGDRTPNDQTRTPADIDRRLAQIESKLDSILKRLGADDSEPRVEGKIRRLPLPRNVDPRGDSQKRIGPAPERVAP